jgi:hypothetical protein
MTEDLKRAAAARSREAAMKLTHIPTPGDPTLVMCGEDRQPGMKLGSYAEVRAQDDAGWWACVVGWDEAAHVAAYFRAQGML